MRRLLALLVVLGSAGPATAASPEDRLSAVFQAVESNRLDDALKRVEALIRDHPNFRLAHLVRGDLLLARARPLETFGNVAKTVPQDKIADLRDEALVRLRAQRQRPGDDRLPRQILQLHEGQRHALLVDSRRSRLYVFTNDAGRPRLIAPACTNEKGRPLSGPPLFFSSPARPRRRCRKPRCRRSPSSGPWRAW